METKTEEYTVSGKDVVDTVKKIIDEGNARRIIIKNEAGNSLIEFPLTIGPWASSSLQYLQLPVPLPHLLRNVR